jgi:hypothetical protein
LRAISPWRCGDECHHHRSAHAAADKVLDDRADIDALHRCSLRRVQCSCQNLPDDAAAYRTTDRIAGFTHAQIF